MYAVLNMYAVFKFTIALSLFLLLIYLHSLITFFSVYCYVPILLLNDNMVLLGSSLFIGINSKIKAK